MAARLVFPLALAGIAVVTQGSPCSLRARKRQKEARKVYFACQAAAKRVTKQMDEIMVGFENWYMVMEVFLDPNRELGVDDPIVLTQFNVSKAIRDSILMNFGTTSATIADFTPPFSSGRGSEF
ncbi:hypothetical protein NL676_000447 [Syzygium grande]|nr:hypothetical protein NL676_000447 [Syzygium grande]